MALTKVSGGILQQPIDVGIITATSIQVGSGTTIHDAGIDLGSGNITSHNINSTGIVTSTGLDVNGNGDISGDLSVSGNVSIGGTLTYEDVTNIDSVGVITARSGINVTGGNVDIGGATHSRNLSVHDATNGVILIEGASDGTSNLMFADENDEDVGMLGYNHASNYLAFTVNAAERLRITSSGNVGIGLTNPATKLHLSSGSATQLTISNTSNSMSDGDTMGTIDFTAGSSNTINARVAGAVEGTGEAGGDLVFETRTDGGSLGEKVRITSAGAVGIGTDNPSNYGGSVKLALHNTGNSVLSIVAGTSSDSSILFADGTSGDATYRGNIKYAHDGDSMRFHTAAAERLRVTSTGHVGIATTNPVAKLHVHGGTNDTPAYFDTSNANGAHIRFLQGGSIRHFLGCGGGISLGDKDDLTMRAYDNIIFATANSSTRKATLSNGGAFIVGATSSAVGLVHVQHDAITAAAPSLGWPHYVADTDDNAKTVLHLETAGNGSVSTAGQGATVVLNMGQYYDSRAVITTRAAGGASPSDQGTGSGKDLLVKGGRSDNNNGKYGGRLFLNGGSGYNGNAYDTNYGHCVIQGLGGRTGVGILAPTSKLEVHESLSSSGATGAAIFVVSNERVNTGSSAAAIRFRTNEISGTNQYTRAQISSEYDGTNNNNGRLMFATADTNGNLAERLRITGSGDFWVSGNSMNHLKNEYRGSTSVTGTNTESFAFEFVGSALASGGLLYFWGTSGNVVVNVSAEILINHSADVTIKSMSGAYTQGRIRVKTDNNTRCAVYLGRSGGYGSGTTSLNWRFIPYGGTYAYTTESTNNGTDHTHNTTSGSFRITAAGGGGGHVNASGSKNFLIDHPLVGLATTTRLAHAAVEGPECNTMYRGKVDLVDGTASVNIDTNSRMTEGTFEALNQNVQCFTTNETGWTAIKGSVSGNLLTITAQDNTCTDTISWMVVGERHDQDIINNRATDSEGRFIPEVTDEYDPSQFPIYPEES